VAGCPQKGTILGKNKKPGKGNGNFHPPGNSRRKHVERKTGPRADCVPNVSRAGTRPFFQGFAGAQKKRMYFSIFTKLYRMAKDL